MNCMYVHYEMLDSASSYSLNRMSQSSNEMEVDKLTDSSCGEHVKSLQFEFLKHLEEEENVDAKSEIDKSKENVGSIIFNIMEPWFQTEPIRATLGWFGLILVYDWFDSGSKNLEPIMIELVPKLALNRTKPTHEHPYWRHPP